MGSETAAEQFTYEDIKKLGFTNTPATSLTTAILHYFTCPACAEHLRALLKSKWASFRRITRFRFCPGR
jgi:hypothetical protein